MIVVMVALIVTVFVPVVFGLVLFLFFRRSRALGWGRGRRCYIRPWLWWRWWRWCGYGDRQTVAADGDIDPVAGHCRN